MGLFHCPVGAAFYDDEGCIDCGMCLADSREEMVEASKKIRVYLTSQAGKKDGRIGKIAVCGKGGTGKSTITVLMANAFANQGYNVLVLDTDESNPGLFRMFGFNEPPDPLISLVPRLAEGTPEPDKLWLTRDEILIQDIPPEYTVERDGIQFAVTGKIEDPFQGCACSMGVLARNFVERLVLSDKEIVLIDMEAGVESFGRGIERSVDAILIVTEPSFEAISIAEKINFMAQGMGIKRVWAILNKITTEEVEQRMRDRLYEKGIDTIGAMDFDSRISAANFEGTTPVNKWALDRACQIIREILN